MRKVWSPRDRRQVWEKVFTLSSGGDSLRNGHRKAESARMGMIGIYPTSGTLAKAAFQDRAERCYRKSLCQAHLVLGGTVILNIHLILSQTFDMTTSQFFHSLKEDNHIHLGECAAKLEDVCNVSNELSGSEQLLDK